MNGSLSVLAGKARKLLCKPSGVFLKGPNSSGSWSREVKCFAFFPGRPRDGLKERLEIPLLSPHSRLFFLQFTLANSSLHLFSLLPPLFFLCSLLWQIPVFIFYLHSRILFLTKFSLSPIAVFISFSLPAPFLHMLMLTHFSVNLSPC